MFNKSLVRIIAMVMISTLFFNGCSFSKDTAPKTSVSEKEAADNADEKESIENASSDVSTESITEAVTEAATETATESITETEALLKETVTSDNQNKLSDTDESSYVEKGYWIFYSPQARMFTAYQFKDGVVNCKEYDFTKEAVSLYSASEFTYSEEENGVVIYLGNMQMNWEYEPNGKDYMIYLFEDICGPQAGEKGAFKIFHVYEIPDYNTACEQSKDRYITEPYTPDEEENENYSVKKVVFAEFGFSLELPSSWVYEKHDDSSVYLCEKNNYEAGHWGRMCSILLFESTEDYTTLPNYEVLGVKNGITYVAVRPTGVEFNCYDEYYINEWTKANRHYEAVLSSFKLI
ncbi:MAG: hypothetical protein UD936_04350 [Acutalibacteraceae bacterium]|nr:hypothetical protein [Acutalibacteraceae bacterium]